MPTDIQIMLYEGEGEPGGWQRFEPGAKVRGTVRVTPDRELRCNHFCIRLRWYTEGRGDRDQGTVGSVDAFQGTLPANVPASFDFRLTLPREPWSYAGHYINILWEVVAELDVPLARDLHGRANFILAPPAETALRPPGGASG